jgi:hypothetical protein
MTWTSREPQWVLLAYRLPRIPSTPRSNVWRKLKRLGVVQISDGLVALPHDDRTREALEWTAEEVHEYGGEASVWLGHPADSRIGAALRARMDAAVAAEYAAVATEATEADDASNDVAQRRRVVARLRRELHRINARDFFGSPDADPTRLAVEDLAARTPGPGARQRSGAELRVSEARTRPGAMPVSDTPG